VSSHEVVPGATVPDALSILKEFYRRDQNDVNETANRGKTGMKRQGQGTETDPGKRKDRKGDVPARQGYGAFRDWVTRNSEEEPGTGGQEERTIDAWEPARRGPWLRRIFEEGDTTTREAALRCACQLSPGEAGAFLRAVLASQETRLSEKKRARDLLRKRFPEEGTEGLSGVLDAAWSFVERVFPTQESGGAEFEEPHEDGWAIFDSLPRPFQVAVARDLLEQGDRAVPLWKRLVAERESLWEELLPLLADHPTEGAAELIRFGYQRTGEKSLRKKMKKVMHKRRAGGLPACTMEDADPGRRVWSPPVPPRAGGLLSIGETPDSRMVWVFRPNVPRGMLVFTGWLHDRQGMIQFFLTEMSRTDAEKYREAMLNSVNLTVVEAEPGYCAGLLEEAFKRGAPGEKEEEEAYKSVRPLLKEMIPHGEGAHPVQALLSPEGEAGGAGERHGESARLLDHPMLTHWRMERMALREHQAKREAIETSRIIVHPLQKRERIESLYREVTAQVFSSPEDRRRWKGRMEDTAWVLFRKGDVETARRLAGLAGLLEDPDRDAGQAPFFVALVRKTMEEWMEQNRVSAKQTPSLIVKPS
jgi:hypothetical protein